MIENTKKIMGYIALLSLAIWTISYFISDNFPGSEDILDELLMAPIQIISNKEPFEVKRKEIVYTVEPLYSYELYGMVVSYNNSNKWYDYYHKQWKDYLNIRDLCVIWGSNTDNELYKEIDFSHGSFTCYCKTSNMDAWRAFDMTGLSNNHLLATDQFVAKNIMDAKVGDQIYFKGYLSHYSHNQGFERGTSTVRTDKGNGACETVFITDFQILKEANMVWRGLHTFSFLMLVISVIAWFIAFMKAPIIFR
jgi:hypothetical protein